MNKEKKEKISKYALLALLVAMAFLFIGRGVDFSDSGYNVSNFVNFPNVNRTWMLSTVLSMAIGKVLTFLPFGHTLLGIKIYCALIVAAFAGAFYMTLSKVFSPVFVFAGEAMAFLVAWCPYVILYHYLSYFFFAAAGLLLAKGLSEDNNLKIALSGALLALNVFICFPNICEAALGILIIIDMAVQRKNRAKEIGIFAGAYLFVLIVGVGLNTLIFGKDAYPDMIGGLFSISKDAPSYSPLNMVLTILDGYRWDIWYFVAIAVVTITGAMLYVKYKGKKLAPVITILVTCFTLGILRIMRYYGRITFEYKEYSCYYAVGILLVMFSIVIGVACVFNKKLSVYERLLAALVPIIIFITPIGSNNGMYTIYCALFPVFPILFGLIFKSENRVFSAAPVKASVAVIAILLIVQGVLFRVNFVFRDLSESYVMLTKEDSKVLAGNRTSPEKKAYIAEFDRFLEDNDLKGKDTIIFGHIPMTSFAFNLPNAISHIWPSLDSYTYEELERELSELKDTPLFVYHSDYGDLLTKDLDECYTKKEVLLATYLRENNYRVVFRNEYFTLCDD